MEKNNCNLLINIEDKYGSVLTDKRQCSHSSPPRPAGFVEVYEVDKYFNKKKLVSKSNLVVTCGREIIAQRSFNVQNENLIATPSYFIGWLGVGDGGANISDPFDPVSPENGNIELANEISLSTSSTSYGDLRTGNYYKKQIDSVTYEQDPYNDNKWLIAKVQATLNALDCIDSQINELGLFMATSLLAGHSGPFFLFARVTMATIVKEAGRQFIISWHLFF